MSLRTSVLPTCAGGAPCPTAQGSEPETAPCAARLGGGVGILIYRSDRAVCVSSAMFLPALLHPRVPFLTVENLVSAGSLACCTHSVDILPLPLKCLQNTSFTKAARRERCLVPLVCTAGSLSETLRLNSKSWNPELLYISRGQFIISNTYLQFNYTTIQVIPLLKPKRREKSTPLQLFIFLFYFLLYIMA